MFVFGVWFVKAIYLWILKADAEHFPNKVYRYDFDTKTLTNDQDLIVERGRAYFCSAQLLDANASDDEFEKLLVSKCMTPSFLPFPASFKVHGSNTTRKRFVKYNCVKMFTNRTTILNKIERRGISSPRNFAGYFENFAGYFEVLDRISYCGRATATNLHNCILQTI
jgi:hypothetical protein